MTSSPAKLDLTKLVSSQMEIAEEELRGSNPVKCPQIPSKNIPPEALATNYEQRALGSLEDKDPLSASERNSRTSS